MNLFNLKKIRELIFIILCVFLITSNAYAQQEEPSPLKPGKFHTQRETGIYFGLGQNIQSGSFFTKCDCPEFENGVAFGWKAGLLYEQDITPVLQIGAAVGINQAGVTASYQYNKDRVFTTDIGGTIISDTVPILFRQQAETQFLNFDLMPYLKWTATDFFFLRLGFNLAFNITSNIRHSEEILQTTVKLPSTGEIVEVTFEDGSTKVVVEDNAFPDVVSPQFYVVPAVGFTIPLSTNIFLSPVFDYSLPLSEMSSNGNNFKISNWRFIAELRWAIKLRQE
jgi:hypothetical protein